MRLTVFNGSPRGKKGNTEILLAQFTQGFASIPDNSHTLYHLNRVKEHPAYAQAFSEAEAVLIGFPLYTDAMPGLVMAFIESLEPYCGRVGNPSLGFLVQSGFPEATHSRHVEKYLEKLVLRLGSPYIGTIIKGGCEGIRLATEKSNQKLFAALYEIGRDFGTHGQFDTAQVAQLATPERFPGWITPLLGLLFKMGITNGYWNQQLKNNEVYAQRFARPYTEEVVRS